MINQEFKAPGRKYQVLLNFRICCRELRELKVTIFRACVRSFCSVKPNTLMEGKDAVILWDMPIHTDKEITANRPDIVIKDKKGNKCTFIDMSVPSERNVANKEIENLSKYKDLEIEVHKMWNMKTTTVSVIVGALGLIRKQMNDHVSKIPGRIYIDEIQKIVLLGTSHILRRALSIT